MKRNHITQLKLIWGGVFVLFVASFVYLKVVPTLFSGMDPVDPARLTGEYDYRDQKGKFLDQEVVSAPVPGENLASVLGDSTSKRIEVDLTNQRVYAYEGDRKVYEFVVSTGKWGPTPTGTFRIWGKYRYTKMSGGNPALHTYYYLPNVPYVMFFGNDQVPASRGFSLHGTYWHNNFGHPMSHGCVNMRTEDAQTLFYWSDPAVGDKNTARADKSNPGTMIVIYGTAPKD